MTRIAWPAALLALLCACGQDLPRVGDAAQASAGAPATSTSEGPAAAATGATLALTADGVVRAPGRGEPVEPFAFGVSRATVESAVERIAGPATGRGHNGECGAGPMDFTEYGALTLNFMQDRFAGWFADSGTRVPTVDGVLPGIARSELESERSVTMIAGSTLEGEFEYALPGGGAIGGIFDGSGADSRVAALYAGTNCFFR